MADKPYKLLVSGWRDLPATHRRVVVDKLDEHLALVFDMLTQPMVVVHGAATGADAYAHQWARFNQFATPDPHPADWPTCAPDCKPAHRKRNRRGDWYCPTAGRRRNQLLLDLAPSYALLFPGPPDKSTGTPHMAGLLVAAGVEHQTFEYHPDPNHYREVATR